MGLIDVAGIASGVVVPVVAAILIDGFRTRIRIGSLETKIDLHMADQRAHVTTRRH